MDSNEKYPGYYRECAEAEIDRLGGQANATAVGTRAITFALLNLAQALGQFAPQQLDVGDFPIKGESKLVDGPYRGGG